MNTSESVTLVDVLDKVIEKGAIINGDMVIKVADIDLVFLGLRLMITSAARAEELMGGKPDNHERTVSPEDEAYIARLQREIRRSEENISSLISAGSPNETEQGLAKLILTIVEVIRKLMEKEAFRRVRAGGLSSVEIQKLGLSLKAVKKKMAEIQAIFGLRDEDLHLNLGPLGDLT